MGSEVVDVAGTVVAVIKLEDPCWSDRHELSFFIVFIPLEVFVAVAGAARATLVAFC